jgi:TonB family protein
MAHQPMSRPDPSDPPENDEPLFAYAPQRQSPDVVRVASQLAQHAGESSGELALDLVLHEIVEQTRLATMATGAAIALFRDDEMVCRATSGVSAPDLGVRLNTRTGLSGACVRTRQVQRCDDTYSDPRVDTEALRNLDVRSILVVPVIKDNDLVGIFEILSPRVRAFGERDVLTLEALSRRIVQNLESAAKIPEPQPVAAPEPAVEAPAPAEIIPARRDYWTTALTAIVIGLALLLGWMVGYSGWQRARAPQVIATVQRPVQSQGPAAAPSKAASVAEPRAKEKAAPPPAAKTSSSDSAPPPGGLVVYRNGKVVFQMPPEPTAASTVKTAGRSDANPVDLSPEVAATYLRYKVEPEYPAEAKPAEALGPVVVEVHVGKDGAVQQAELVSGDPLLAGAALAAVRQWKYQPYSPDGAPMDFSTKVKVNFKGQ